MCHACDPHRAWLNKSYIYFLSGIPFGLLDMAAYRLLQMHALASTLKWYRRRVEPAVAQARDDDFLQPPGGLGDPRVCHPLLSLRCTQHADVLQTCASVPLQHPRHGRSMLLNGDLLQTCGDVPRKISRECISDTRAVGRPGGRGECGLHPAVRVIRLPT